MISVTNLIKSFGNIKAVDDISFSIDRGEVFGLLGPNGAGKTTTINMMVGVINPDGGRVSINGEGDPTRPSIRNQLGNAPQSLALYEPLTARENLTFFAKLYGFSGKELAARVEAALAFAGLADRQKSRVATFSGGMKRRLNMAAAIVHDPPVILFDEPTVGVDPQSRNMIFESIEKLKADGRTIIYTTHYMEEAQRLCDRVAIIDHGKILALDTVDSLIEKYGGQSLIEATFAEVPQDSSNIPGILDGRRLKLETDDPMRDLAQLSRIGAKFTSLKVERPNLEKVFLHLTGRSLRD